MSRIGKEPVTIPAGVTPTIATDSVTVKGPKGELRVGYEPQYVTIAMEDGALQVSRADDSKEARSRHGLYRNLLQNAVLGVTEGFEKRLEVKGVGYRWAVKGSELEMNLGFSHPVHFAIPKGIEMSHPEKQNNVLIIRGLDKQLVGQVAADIRQYRKPEPYKGKGIRYVGEVIAMKQGKTLKK
ncbi:50S ribosomal protein L6 [Candidatus Peribacteria bacterium]|nr:50S ribosomal protein L6 [Candidatus Peribacteria bacterium]